MVKRLYLILTLVFAPVTLLYAAPPTGNVYAVEVIVFENRLPDLEGGELWRNQPDKSADTDIAVAINAGAPAAPDSSLSAAADALEKSGHHHVLAHLLWQQTAEAKSVSTPVKISSAEAGLDGALRFYLSRYLLVDLNLTLRGAAGGGLFGVSEPDTPVYRLSEYRRVKLLETHYFDHPKFGALVRVAPVKAN